MKTSDIRQTFLKFFEGKGHTIVASSPVVPGDDPTLLFTNAGMNQFKDVFLGFDKRPYARATTAQKCIRAGGKHNDLENVGYTARHHTFFEMLGNFSFGDYFKKDAIAYAWELLTEVYKLPAEKLWVTVYAEDDEAYDIWHREVGVPAERIVRIGDNKGARYASDNFWMMGDTGPCGPCTEIFYDHGPDIAGGPPGSPDEDGDRYIEIWNNVFMQFNRDDAGTMHRCPSRASTPAWGSSASPPCCRACTATTRSTCSSTCWRRPGAPSRRRARAEVDADSPSLKVIADHIRACAFTIADGVIPGNEGRGYVLRRICRRAIRHGYKLGARKPFLHALLPALVAEMGDAYPELRQGERRIADVLKPGGGALLPDHRQRHGDPRGRLRGLAAGKALDGELAFKLHDTYGFPLDLTADVCRERGVTVDDRRLRRRDGAPARRRRARPGVPHAAGRSSTPAARPPSTATRSSRTRRRGSSPCTSTAPRSRPPSAGDDAVVVLDHTPFYAESGGQVGDTGELRSAGSRFVVEDTQKIQADVFGHHGRVARGPRRRRRRAVGAGRRRAPRRRRCATTRRRT